MADFRVDVLLSSFKELQQERDRLQAKLANERSRRQDLENKLDVVTARFNHANDRYNKMLETKDLATQKVMKSQEQVNRLQVLYEEKQADVATTKGEIEHQKQMQHNETEKFQMKLKELTDSFRHAHKFYNDTALHNECKQWEEKSKLNEIQAEETKQIVANLCEERGAIPVKSDKQKKEEEELEQLEKTLKELLSECLHKEDHAMMGL